MHTTTFDRLQALQQTLTSEQALLLSNPTDVTYFSGFTMLVPEEREAFLLITKSKIVIMQASFSPVMTDNRIIVLLGCYPTKLAQHLTTELAELTNPVLLFDPSDLRVDEWQTIQQQVQASLVNIDKAQIWKHTMTKLPTEITASKQAGQVAARAFAALRPKLHAGMTELEVKNLLEQLLNEFGSERPAFPTIVAFGAHGALPHHQPSATKLKNEMAVLIDFGATVASFRSDISRSFWFGSSPSAEFKQVQTAVMDAYQASVAVITTRVHTPVTAAAVDEAARSTLKKHGYGQYFIHTTGHGLGLDIHEQPSLNSHNQTQLTTDMVLTVEPGVYLEGQFGFRYENTLLLTDTGFEELTVETE